MNRLNASLESDRKTREEKETRIAELQSAVARLQAEPKPAPPAAAPRARASTAPGAAHDAADALKRTAAYWASMDAEKAAAVAQRLPDEYVNRVFAQMAPDAVADIMNALPAKVAAHLTAVSAAH
ncbi:MAG: magnesium transporter MgtE N-terminal domain-containing protein [Candidatus Velthaea sp.]